jgi:hypothetical protein
VRKPIRVVSMLSEPLPALCTHGPEYARATSTRRGDAYTSIDNVDRCKPIRARHGMGKRNDGREGRLHPRPAIGNLADGRFKL